MKSYTDLEQSRKLAEILSLETADIHYGEYCAGGEKYPILNCDDDYNGQSCWSLAALLGVLPFPVLYMEMLGGMILWSCECHFMETDEVVKIEHYNNPVDACYEMILKLHELKML